jgi:hypothetical protein
MATVNPIEREMAELELALLRRGVDQRAAGRECCASCQRTPLTGERIYLYEGDRVLCELCRKRHRQEPLESRIVHTPAAGHTIRIIDQRAS